MSTSEPRRSAGRELAALAALLVWALRQEPPTFPHEPARLAELAAAVALYLAACAARAERWFELLCHNGAPRPRAPATPCGSSC